MSRMGMCPECDEHGIVSSMWRDSDGEWHCDLCGFIGARLSAYPAERIQRNLTQQ
jgi:ribosomal protein L37AE/L43A